MNDRIQNISKIVDEPVTVKSRNMSDLAKMKKNTVAGRDEMLTVRYVL